MLPFLKDHKQATPAASLHSDEGEQNIPDPGIHAAAEDILKAIESKDAAGLASALEAALTIHSSKE
jgi:hypothetical protein